MDAEPWNNIITINNRCYEIFGQFMCRFVKCSSRRTKTNTFDIVIIEIQQKAQNSCSSSTQTMTSHSNIVIWWNLIQNVKLLYLCVKKISSYFFLIGAKYKCLKPYFLHVTLFMWHFLCKIFCFCFYREGSNLVFNLKLSFRQPKMRIMPKMNQSNTYQSKNLKPNSNHKGVIFSLKV